MHRYYEEKLPEGYSEALTVDANDKKQAMKFQAVAILSAAVLINVFFFLYALPRLSEIAAGFTVLKCAGLAAAYFLYVVLHELTHGLVYKLLTGKKLTFGFKPPSAFCGVPGIYTYRITSLLSLSAPLTVFSLLFAVLFFVIRDPFAKAMVLLLFTFHIAGCSGDLYGIFLFLTRFRDPAVLRKDSGPVQVYCIKA